MPCGIEGCTAPIENEETGLCAGHGFEKRKAERAALKPKKTYRIKKESKKRGKQNRDYNSESKEFLKGKFCAHFKDRPATEVHHMKGRDGYADQWARDNGIPLLLDKRFWLPVSHEAHGLITENSAWAIEMGYSLLRTEKKKYGDKFGNTGQDA